MVIKTSESFIIKEFCDCMYCYLYKNNLMIVIFVYEVYYSSQNNVEKFIIARIKFYSFIVSSILGNMGWIYFFD